MRFSGPRFRMSVLLCVLASALVMDAAPGDVEWVREFETIGPTLTTTNAVATDPAGNVYVAGTVAGVLPGQAGTGPTDAFVRQYDASGNVVWTHQFGTPGVNGDHAYGIAVDASGIYVAGVAAAALPGLAGAGGPDVFVRKYDFAGSEAWTRQFGSSGIDEAFGVAVGPDGVYVVGAVSGSLPGQAHGGSRDAFVRLYDAGGNEIWTQQFGTTGTDEGIGVSADAWGAYVVGGIGPGSSDAFIRRYSSGGALLWSQTFGGVPFGSDQAIGVSADPSGAYVVGTVGLDLPGQDSPDSNNAWVRKYDPAGAELWTRQFTTGGDDDALAVSVGASGLYVAGAVEGVLPGETSAGSADAFVRKYGLESGDEIWTQQFGTAGPDRALGVSTGPLGVHVVGSAGGVLPGQVREGLPDAFLKTFSDGGAEVRTHQFGTLAPLNDLPQAIAVDGQQLYVAGVFGLTVPFQMTHGGGFVRAYDPAGNELWTRYVETGGLAGLQAAWGVAADSSGVYVVGQIAGALPGQSNAGGNDAYIRKYDTAGEVVWTHQFGSLSSQDAARGVAVDESGVYVTGALPPPGAGLPDVFLRKYSLDGAELWTQFFGSLTIDQGQGVATHDQRVYVAGTVAGSLPGQMSAGGSDAFVRAYDQGGLELWTAQFGTAGSDQVEGIAADDSGLYVAGFTRGTSLPPSTEAFVRKFDRDGVTVWEHRYGAGPALNTARSVSVDSTGVYVADLVGQAASVRKLTGAGVEVWSRQLQNGQSEPLWAAAVSAGPSGLFAAGSVASMTRSAGGFVAKLAHATLVTIDIRPGDDANTVVLRSKGHLPVAILSTATFDAASVDPGAVTLAGAAVVRRPNGPFMATAADIDGDGFDDLLLHFAAQELQLSETDTEAHLTGVTFEGEQIGGTDAVRVIP